MRRRSRIGQTGQAALEYIIVAGGVVLPLTFMIIFTAQLLWTWHSVVPGMR
jgi:hypothetical protein